MLLGENGIIKQAKDAKEETNRTGAREKLQIEASGSYEEGKYNVNKAKENLENNLNIKDEKITDNNGVLTVEYENHKFYIDKKGKVTEGITSEIIESNPTEYFGKSISNYECENSEGVSEWQIFHADDNNIYLISKNPITSQYVPDGKKGTKITGGTTTFNLNTYVDYEGSKDILDETIPANKKVSKWLSWLDNHKEATSINIRATAYILDTEAWKGFKGDKGEYAVGAPTLDLFCASYNNIYPNKKILIKDTGGWGYNTKWSDSEADYVGILNGVNSFGGLYSKGWIASPYRHSSANWIAYATNGRIWCEHTASALTFYPVVCLNSDVELNEVENGIFEIK